jgi:dipeptidase E
MKFLLTSNGISNVSIEKALLELLEKPLSETKVVFIPTAANYFSEDKSWLVEDMNYFREKNFPFIDIVDLAALKKEQWLPRLEAVDLICVGGGSEQYLAQVMQTSGCAAELPRLLEHRVYMGISAGGMYISQFLEREALNIVYPEETFEGELFPSLGLVDCHVLPHLNSSFFSRMREDVIRSTAGKNLQYPLYALDDNSALKVVDGQIEVVTEGEFLKLEK